MESIDVSNENKNELDENINLYAQSLKRKDPSRINSLKKFINFCINNKKTVNKTSIEDFIQKYKYKGKNIRSHLNVFRKFCKENNLDGYWYQLQSPPTKYRDVPLILSKFINECNLTNEKTKHTYFKELKQFFFYINERNIPFAVESVNKYLQTGALNKTSFCTLNVRLAAIKAFGRWLINQKGLTRDLLAFKESFVYLKEARSYRVNRDLYHIKTLSIDERDEVISKIESLEEKIVISLQTYEGLRAGELQELLIEDINFDEYTISVKKKTIRLFNVSRKLIQEFIGEKKEGPLFGKMKYSQVYRIVKKHLSKYKPISLRHTAAQIMLERNIPIEFVQLQMRHASISTTLLYVDEQEYRIFLKSSVKEI